MSRPVFPTSARAGRILALIRKEAHQIGRDPSTVIIAVILPLTLIFLFGYGVSFDARRIDIGLVIEAVTPDSGSFSAALTNSRIFAVRTARGRRAFEDDLVAGRIDGVVVLPAAFSAAAARGDPTPIQVLVDGSDPNKAALVRNYLQGAWVNWLTQEAIARGQSAAVPITVEPRVWFNPEIASHHYLVPGSISIIMMLIGALLTALVVAREWERGTMEALLATPVAITDLLAGKLIPYFALGMITMALATATALFVFGVPFRGSFGVLALMSAVFLVTALAQGLLISTLARNQLVAAQSTMISAFLPSFFLSGFVFEIDGMPWPLRLLSYGVPARYFVAGLQTLFLAGDVWSVIWPNLAGMAALAAVYIALTALKTQTRLDRPMTSRLWSLIVKELLANWRDRRNRIILLIAPMVQVLVFSFAATQEVKNVPLAVLDESGSVASRELISRFAGSPQFAQVLHLNGAAEIAPTIDSRAAPAVLRIGPDFGRKLTAGQPARLQLLLDGRRSNAAQIIQGYALEIVDRFNAEVAHLRGLHGPPSVTIARTWFNPNSDTLWSTVPGLFAVLTTSVGMMVSALSVARERELGSFEQLLVSPLTSGEILAGKAASALLIAMGETTIIMFIAMYVLAVPMVGSMTLLYGAMVVYLLAIIGIGLFISSLSSTQQQAIIGTFMFLAPAILLSGYATPVSNMPDWLQTLTLVNPVRHFVVIAKGAFLKDLPVAVIAAHLWPLAAIAVVTLSSAAWLFRRRTG